MVICYCFSHVKSFFFDLVEELGKLNDFVSDGHGIIDDTINPVVNVAVFWRLSPYVKLIDSS